MTNKPVQKNNNFYFALKCAAALTAAALVTAGIVAAVASKTGAATFAFAAGSAVAASPVLPIILGLITTVGLLCCLPLFFIGPSTRTSWFYTPGSFFSTPVYTPACVAPAYSRPVYSSGHLHGHSNSIFSPPGGGGGFGHVHSHPIGGGGGPAPGGHFHSHR